MVLERGCVIDGKIWMSQRKVEKTGIALGENDAFHYENIACRNQRML